MENRGAAAVSVVVIEPLFRGAGAVRVVNARPAPVSQDGDSVVFRLDVPAGGSATASYEAVYEGAQREDRP